MATITLDIDDDVLQRAERWAEARRMSVGEVVASALSELGSGVPATLPDEGHRQILAALEPTWGQDLSERDKLHDRGRARAETYMRNRARLLLLVDSTDGDMGEQRWDRSRLYDR